jgi:hypothetical protein
LSALETVIVTGEVLDPHNQLMTSFSGTLYLTVFDKVQQRKTLANDEKSSERNFASQTRQLFKGACFVESGLWSIEFVMPKILISPMDLVR